MAWLDLPGTQTSTASGFDVFQAIALAFTAASLVVAAIQVRRGSRLTNQSRQATLSWSIYQEYIDPRIRSARGNTQVLAHSADCPTTGEEYLERVADGSPWTNNAADGVDSEVRRLLRFYNQLSILLDEGLINENFLFGLVGPGLASAWPALRPAVDYYEHFYGEHGEIRWHDTPRLIYHNVPELHARSLRWIEQRREKARPHRPRSGRGD